MYVAVQTGNFLYFLPMILLVLTCVGLTLLCRKKGEKFADRLILGLCIFNFALHFLKQLMPGYLWTDWPFCLRQSTPENLCALLITVSPFLYRYGSTHFKDYLMVVGLASGVMVFLVPTTALDAQLDNVYTFFEVGRFYLCHAILIIVAILISGSGFHHFSYKRIPYLGLLFLAAELIIVINEASLWACKIIDLPWKYFLSRDVRNASLSFGPSGSMDSVLGGLYWMCGIQWDSNGVHYFVPVLWMILPILIFGYPFIFLLTLPFTYKEINFDRSYAAQLHRMRREEKAKMKELKQQEVASNE